MKKIKDFFHSKVFDELFILIVCIIISVVMANLYFKKQAINHHAAQYNSITGDFEWLDEINNNDFISGVDFEKVTKEEQNILDRQVKNNNIGEK